MQVDCVFARNDISDGGSGGLSGGLLGFCRHFCRALEWNTEYLLKTLKGYIYVLGDMSLVVEVVIRFQELILNLWQCGWILK